MAELPEIPADVAEPVAAIKQGDYVVCYAKCAGCSFGECPAEPHTWMDSDDLDHAGLAPKSEEAWEQLAKDRPCGCHCMRVHQARTDTETSPSEAMRG